MTRSTSFFKIFLWGGFSHKSTLLITGSGRVGHGVLLRSERIVLLRSFKALVLFSSFLRSSAFFCVLLRSFLRNIKERKERNVLLQRT